MERLKLFLDANVLFSAALGGRSFALVWRAARVGKVSLVTSVYCLTEAERNVRRKAPAAVDAFRSLREDVRVVEDAHDAPATEVGLPSKDVPVYAAAVETGADMLLTGDLKHFGPLMDRDDLPVRVMTVRTFLLAPGND